uniref:IS200/IS605 family transposase n=1 Tax=Methanolobus psychrotolerans TaxID=1874706 RepID=UPI001F5DA560|nr:IS200/IS605 family transposase [Methanolobus psychrotolerans]
MPVFICRGRSFLRVFASFRNHPVRNDPEHIHLFISAPPFIAQNDIVKIMKGVAKRVFQKFPELRKKEFRGNHLWSPSYYVGTHDQVSAETIEKYIDGSSNRERNSSTCSSSENWNSH